MQITKETFFKVVSFLTNDKVNEQELSDYLSDDLESGEELFDAIKEPLKDYKKSQKAELIGKGYRQASSKTEKLIQEVFGDVEFESTKQDDMFIQLRDTLKSKEPVQPSKSKKSITFEEALKSEEVRLKFQELTEKASKVDEIQGNFDSYKNFIGLRDTAFKYLTEAGARFDDNPAIRELQQKAIQDKLSSVKTKKQGDDFFVLDDDGDIVINEETAKPYSLKDYVLKNSPVKFGDDAPVKKDKNIYTPESKGSVNSGFGFPKDHKFKHQEFRDALKEGKTEKAEYIKTKLYEQSQPKQE